MSDTGRLKRGQPNPPDPAGQPDQANLRITAEDMAYLAATAGRAPSVHNSQPWQFRLRANAVELHADPGRMLRQVDPDGREMLISCGAVLYGLRLGMRRLGYLPDTEVLPDPAQPALIARVRPAGRALMTRDERDLIAAVPHRHTHRGPFAPVPVSARLLAVLVLEAAAEGATLVLVNRREEIRELAGLTAAAGRAQRASPGIRAELRQWTRSVGSAARDGIPAHAWAEEPGQVPATPGVPAVAGASGTPDGTPPAWRQEQPAHERLPQRDFGLPGALPGGGPLPSATAVLTTADDSPADWLRAGQALDRLLLRAATRWVFASLQTQPLESPPLRAEIRDRLHLAGMPQMLLQFGRANTAPATARRPVSDVMEDSIPAPRDQP